MNIGVIAGTPVDTSMGIEYIKSKGHFAIGRYCSETPVEQSRMQILYKEELEEIVIKLCKDMINECAEGIFINCNSLSGAIDISKIRKKISVEIVTPLDVYKECAHKYKILGVIAANCQSIAAIESIISNQNPNCIVCGAGILPLVMAIESGKPAQDIYDELNLNSLTDHLSALKCEAIILGCTHFPYIVEQLKKNIHIPIIDPGNRMLEILTMDLLSFH